MAEVKTQCSYNVQSASYRLRDGVWLTDSQQIDRLNPNMMTSYPIYIAVLGLAARRILAELGRDSVDAQWRALGRRSTTPGVEWERREAHA